MGKRLIAAISLLCILGMLYIVYKSEPVITVMTHVDMSYSTSKTAKEPGTISYKSLIERLDEKLLAMKEATAQSEQYWEKIEEIFLYRKNVFGILEAEYQDGKVFSFQIAMEEGTDKQKYWFYSLGNDVYWFSCQLVRADDINLPDYTVNENVLRYYSLAEEDNEWERAQICYHQELSAESQEYIIRNEKIFQIDRERNLLTDVSDSPIRYIAKWLLEQPKRISLQLMRDDESLTHLKSIIPKNYELYDSDYTVNDLNQDGYDDYIAALYPKDTKDDELYVDETDPFYYDPYYRSPYYCASGFWLLLSKEDGSYEASQLSDNIEYMEEPALMLISMQFVEDNLLELEYFVGRSPWCNAVVQFTYDSDKQQFYLYKTFYRETDVHLIADCENYGDNTSMYYYYDHSAHYTNTIWQTDYEEHMLSENQSIRRYVAKLVYRCDEIMKEKYINGSIWKLEKDILEHYIKKYPEFCIGFETERYAYNDRMLSGFISIDEIYDKEFVKMYFPVLLDKDSYEIIDIKQLVTKQEFIQAVKYQEGMEQEEFMDKTELERCLTLLDTYWDNVNNVEAIMEPDKTDISIIVEDAGVCMKMYSTDDDTFQDSYFIEKEYFMNTGLWEYFSVD